MNDSKHTIVKVSRANINVRYKRTRGDKACSKGWKFTQFFVVGLLMNTAINTKNRYPWKKLALTRY